MGLCDVCKESSEICYSLLKMFLNVYASLLQK